MNTKSKFKMGLVGLVLVSAAGCCPQYDYNAKMQEMIRQGKEVPLYTTPVQEKKHLHFYVSNELEGN